MAAKELTAAEAIADLARQLKPKTTLELAGLSPEQEAKLLAVPPPKRWRMVPCRSEDTGATFTAHVVESRGSSAGRVTQLHDYTFPRGSCTYVSQGGLVPDGMPILKAGTSPPVDDGAGILKHDFEIKYLHWKITEIYQPDHRRHVGHELRPFMCVDPDGMKTPWNEGKSRAFLGMDE